MKTHNKILKVVIHKASENLEKVHQHYEGHRTVLKDLGFPSNYKPQILESTFYISIEEAKTKHIVAGCRLESSVNTIPTQKIIKCSSSDLLITKNEECYEFCGLWNSKKYAGLYLSRILLKAALVFSKYIGIKELITFTASYSKNVFMNEEFQILKHLGKEGMFKYPNDNFEAYIMKLDLRKTSSDFILDNSILNKIKELNIELEYNLQRSPIVSIQRSLSIVDFELYNRLISKPELINELNWRKFEYLIGDMLESSGFSVDIMQGTKDGGIDIIAFSNNNEFGMHKYVIQAKRSKNKIQVDPVRNLLFVQNHLGATKSCLATTSYFTRGAIELGKLYKWNLELKDRDSIIDWINKTKIIKYGE